MPAGVYDRKPKTRICEVCGAEYTSRATNSKYCPDCAKIKKLESNAKSGAKRAEYFKAYNARRRKGVRPSDVPDVPPDEALYYSEADKLKKTAPIETVLVPKKEDNMDTTREERLKTFPSMSNRLEHPENFTQPTATTMEPADNGTTEDVPNAVRMERHKMLKALAMDKRGTIMSLYSTVCDISSAIETPVAELLDRLTRIDAALN